MPTRADEPIRYLNATRVAEIFDVQLALRSQRAALTALADEQAVSTKLMEPVGGSGSVAFCYLARRSPDSATVVKIGSVVPGNLERGLPSVSSTIAVMDARSGMLVAVLDAAPITTWRTAAASALVAEALCTPPVRNVAIVGSGVQARSHAVAVQETLQPEVITLCGPNALGLADAVEAIERHPNHRGRLAVAETIEQAVAESRLVITCTSSKSPVLQSSWLPGDCLVISIGSYEPDRCEVGQDLLERAAAVIVDDVASAIVHAGPVRQAIESGLLTRDDLLGIGSVFTGRINPHRSAGDVVFYNSTGVGIQDACAAELILQIARDRDLGSMLS